MSEGEGGQARLAPWGLHSFVPMFPPLWQKSIKSIKNSLAKPTKENPNGKKDQRSTDLRSCPHTGRVHARGSVVCMRGTEENPCSQSCLLGAGTTQPGP